MTALAPARPGAVTVDLARSSCFREQYAAVHAAVASAPADALCVVKVDDATPLPPLGWTLHLFSPRYRWEFNGPARAIAAWLTLYRREWAEQAAWSARHGAGA